MLVRPRALVALPSLLLALAAAPAAQAADTATVAAPDGLVARHATHRAGTPMATTAAVHRPQRKRSSAKRTSAKKRSSNKVRGASVTATDPRSDEQWELRGDRPMGIASAWRQTTGGSVIVAVVDTGADLEHPDLAANLWTNPGEIPGNGIDDDGNGYVDDVHGYDFVADDGDPADENGHGTHVAGIIAARGGNGIGVSGVAWRAKLMIVRALDAHAQGTTDTVAEAVRYAVDNGARFINLSLAGPTPTPDLEGAMIYAQQHDALVIVAAGNDGANLATSPTYPASFPEDNIIGVAATTDRGRLSDVSDYGPGADLAAPGEDILSTAVDGGYEWRTGTSMAAPHVTGTLALMASARPDLSGTSLRNALFSGARRSALPVQDGVLDATGALRHVIPAAAWRNAPKVGAQSSRRAKAAKAKRARTRR